jgi:hypothetical protein
MCVAISALNSEEDVVYNETSQVSVCASLVGRQSIDDPPTIQRRRTVHIVQTVAACLLKNEPTS